MMTRPPPVERLVGVYVGRYYGGTETIEIRPNHTFQQTFVKGTNVVYRNSGTWQLSEDSVVFTPFMLLDEEHGGNPERLDGVSSGWYWASECIVFSPDTSYQVFKQ
jgi:hypothetical protein